jgi:mitogen-activated protein kinase kinase kinase
MTWVKGELIGKGTYGRVYLALNVTTGDMIAVKQVEMPRTDRDREDTRQTGMIEALKSEIALLKDLDHPNVVTYLGELGLCRQRALGGGLKTRSTCSGWEESSRYLSM